MSYIYKKYIRLMVMTGSVIAYTCYVSCNQANLQEETITFEEEGLSQSDTKMFNFLVREYAQMVYQGVNSEKVHELIQEKYKEKPELADKMWDKVQIAAASMGVQAHYAFADKK